MPNLKQHCNSSKERTGDEHKDLHEWMDAPQKEKGIDHRTERHDTSFIDEVKEKFGSLKVREFLRHIAEDYEYTARKWGSDCVHCGKPTWHANKLCNKCIRTLNKDKKKWKE